MWLRCWRVGALVVLLLDVVLYPGSLQAQSGLRGPQRPMPLSPAGPMPKLPEPPLPPNEPVLTIELTAVAVDQTTKVDSRVTASYVPSAGRKSGYGYLKPRPDGTLEDSRTYAALYATRGGLLGMKPGEVMMFGVLRHSGIAHGWNKTVRTPTDDEYVYGNEWTAKSEVVRFERTEDGGILTFEPPMYGDANDDEGFGSLQMVSGEDADIEKFRRFRTMKLSEQDLRNWGQFSRSASVRLELNGGTQEYRATVLGGSPEKDVTLRAEGCAHVAVGGFARLEALGEPAGGTYSWSVTPTGMLNLGGASDDSLAVEGASPAKGLVTVKYVAPNGKTASKPIDASAVELRSVNNGAAIEIGQYDFEGKKSHPPREVPIDQSPPGADLITFAVADPAMASLVGLGTTAVAQANERIGSTTAQAKTLCGEPIGPTVNINVVPCDEQTQARVQRFNEQLSEAERQIADGLKESVEKSQELRTDAAYQNAVKNVGKNAFNALTSIAELIALTGKYNSGLSHAAHTLEKILTGYNVGRSASGMLAGDATQDVMVLGSQVPKLNTLVAGYEALHYYEQWIENLNEIASTGDQLANLRKQVDFDLKKLDELVHQHKRFCEKSTQQPPRNRGPAPPPPSNQPPGKTQHGSNTPRASNIDTSSGDGTAEPEPPGEDLPPDLPPEPPPSRTGGFPLESCGCGAFRSPAWGTSYAGLQVIGADMRRTVACSTSFRRDVADSRNAVNVLDTIPERLARATTLPEAEAITALKGILNDLKSGSTKLEAFRQKATVVDESLGSCSKLPDQPGDLVNQGGMTLENMAAEAQRNANTLAR